MKPPGRPKPSPLARRSKKARRRESRWSRLSREVIRLAGGRCTVGADGCLGRATGAHHKRFRSQGGRDEPSNLIAVCAACHHLLHTRPLWAAAQGFIERLKLNGAEKSAHDSSSPDESSRPTDAGYDEDANPREDR